MERFYASLKTLRPMQALILVLILFASGAATYAGYEYSSRGSTSGLEEDQQLIPIATAAWSAGSPPAAAWSSPTARWSEKVTGLRYQ